MGLLRSEAMKYGMLVLPNTEGGAAARKYLDLIGKETSLQLEDMNAEAMKRPYRKFVQRIEEMERILRFLFEEMGRLDFPISKQQAVTFLQADGDYKLEGVEGELKKLWTNWSKFNENDGKLTKDRNEAAEKLQVSKVAEKMLNKSSAAESSLDTPLMGGRVVNNIAGVVLQEEQVRFARAVFRASRGNTFTHFEPIGEKITDPKTGAAMQKAVFVIFFQGNTDDVSAMQTKINKVCFNFGVNTYAWPASAAKAEETRKMLEADLKEKSMALDAWKSQLKSEAQDLITPQVPGRSSKLEEWRLFCIKEKSIYHEMNKFDEGSGMMLRAHVWFAETEEQHIKDILKKAGIGGQEGQTGMLHSIQGVDKRRIPPTYIRTNEFTDVWQCVINTYGVPRYQEINPAFFTVVSFPFIFGMMYGDVGHGTLLFLAGCFLCYKGEKLKDMPNGAILFWVRFLILQLGLYALFAGLLYNDMFSVGLQLFDSRFEQLPDGSYFPTWDYKNEGNGKGGPYPFGVDWRWHGATNELLFMNSLKMKLSVLMGVVQMTLGLILRIMNAIYYMKARVGGDGDKSKPLVATYFGHHIDYLICECVPMMIFMICFFGWMDFMIVYKWVNSMDAPPGIINSLICMAMGPMGVGQTDEFPLWQGTDGGMSSVDVSTIGMQLAMLSVPWLLLCKPIVIMMSKKKDEKEHQGMALVAADEEATHMGAEHDDHEEEGFGEIMIHQIIETIEYVLGTVSHTASYLRIWALSLAHQQLSSVFFEKTLGGVWTVAFPYNAIAIYIMFTVWFAITFAVLLGMDVLECFLHTLRLHWVEFDSKFFKADGKLFEPYNVKEILESSEA